MADTVASQPQPQPQAQARTPVRPRQPQIAAIQTNHQGLDMLSPVNQNGSFEFDRVIKSGAVLKRTRKTKQWRPIYLFLRPNLLSIYKGKDETRLRHQIPLADLTAVARQKDAKKKREHVFGLFSPARNFHLSAPTEQDAQEWVELIRAAARIDEEDEEMVLLSPSGTKTIFSGFGSLTPREHIGSSSSEADPMGRPGSSVSPERMHSARRPSHTLAYSGNEHGSFSDFSDTGGAAHPPQRSSVSLPRTSQQQRNVSQTSNLGAVPDDERVIYHGWLYVLKSKGGVRKWKKVWVVLRPKALGLYKNEEEYSANLIIPFSTIIDVVDIDPASKNKIYCMQIISEEKNFRFCAPNEDSLARWLGAFKSVLVKRREAEQQRVLQAAPNTGNVPPVTLHPATPQTPLWTAPDSQPSQLQAAH